MDDTTIVTDCQVHAARLYAYARWDMEWGELDHAARLQEYAAGVSANAREWLAAITKA